MYLVKIGISTDFSKNELDNLPFSPGFPIFDFVVFYQPLSIYKPLLV